ncbi:hypothetical protein SCLCIDRAFT_162051 [Scleroderma citrinum Foug A]|uniref:Uncharacterized protein n=1 Tax=Scleroderma citrinum Foug A TaxID=1036808 RepID=A0A0C3ERC4_9AGAM|nr:hypothetical protein SCLCIDRAFT_162051 [Scleroderma citrinum Foug A]
MRENKLPEKRRHCCSCCGRIQEPAPSSGSCDSERLCITTPTASLRVAMTRSLLIGVEESATILSQDGSLTRCIAPQSRALEVNTAWPIRPLPAWYVRAGVS